MRYIVYYAKKNINSFFTIKTFLIIPVFLIFTNTQLVYSSNNGLNLFEFLINVISNQYYIIYFLMPYVIIKILNLIKEENYCALIRSRSRLIAYLAQVFSCMIITFLLIGAHIIIALLFGSKMSISLEWSKDIFRSDLMTNFAIIFNNPIIAFWGTIVFLVSGLTLLASTIIFFKSLLSPQGFTMFIILIYVLSIIGMASDLDSFFPFLFVNNFILLNNAMNIYGNNFFVFLILNLIYLLLSVYLIKISAISNRYYLDLNMCLWYFKKWFTKKSLFYFIVLFIFMNIANILNHKEATLFDLVLYLFNGHGYGYFSMIDFLWMFVYNGFVTYILCIYIQNELDNQSIHVVIRTKNKKVWTNSMLLVGGLYILYYICLSITVTISIGAMKYAIFDNTHSVINPIEFSILILKLTSSKFLELYFVYIVIWTIVKFSRSVSISFFTIFAFYLLCVMENMKYLPFGISSLYRSEMVLGPKGVSYGELLVVLVPSILILTYLIDKTYKIRGGTNEH